MSIKKWQNWSWSFAYVVLGLWIVLATAQIVHLRWQSAHAYRGLIKARHTEWRSMIAGREPSIGLANSPITIVEFSDFQCPFCRSTENMLATFSSKHPDQVALYRLNLPLEDIHPYAHLAAIAAECASEQMVREPFQKALFDEQQRFSTLDWVDLAEHARVKNLRAFKSCMEKESPLPLIMRDTALARSLGISMTPTLIVNGLQLKSGVQASDLETIAAHLEGENAR